MKMTKDLSTSVKILIPVFVVVAMTAANLHTAIQIHRDGELIAHHRQTHNVDRTLMKRKALRGLEETRRLNNGLGVFSEVAGEDESSVADGGGTAWTTTNASNNANAIAKDSVESEWDSDGEDLVRNQNGDLVLPDDTEDVGEGNGGGGGGATGYAYAKNGASSQGSGQGGGEGGGSGRVTNPDGSLSEGDGDGSGEGTALAYAYASPTGTASASGSGNGAGYGGGVGANGDDDDASDGLGGLSQNSIVNVDEDGDDGEDGDATTYGIGVAQAWSAGDGMAYASGTGRGNLGKGVKGIGIDEDLDQQGYGFLANEEGAFSTNRLRGSDGGLKSMGTATGVAGKGGIGIGIGIGIGPPPDCEDGDEDCVPPGSQEECEEDDEDCLLAQNSISGLEGAGGNIRITLDISSDMSS